MKPLVPTELIQELEALARELNADSDELNEAIATLEDELTRMNIGISAWVKGSGGSVGYAKLGDRWKFCVAQGDYYTPLLAVDRATRVAVSVHLVELVQELISRAKGFIASVKAARESIGA